MLPRIMAIGVLLVLALKFGNAQLTTAKPPLTHQGPILKPIGGMTVRDVVKSRKYPLSQEQEPPFASYTFLSWKDAARHMEFEITHIGSAYPKARICVYAFQEPAYPYSPPAAQFTSTAQIQNTTPGATSQLVYQRMLSDVAKGTHCTIDFAGFTPSGKPWDPAAPPRPLGIRRGGKRTGGQIPGPIQTGSSAAPFANRDRTAMLGNLVRAAGYVRFFVRIEVPGVATSTSAVVDYGEPQPSSQAATTLEILESAAKAEFEAIWGDQGNVTGTQFYFFRWSSQLSTEAKAKWQISEQPFPESPIFFNDADCNWASGECGELYKSTLPNAKLAQFSADIGTYFPEPSTAKKVYYARILLLNQDGTLAAPPSNVVTMTIPQAKEKSTVQLTPYLSFTAQVVGYTAPMFGTDPDRYLLTRTPDSDLSEWIKLTGDPNPHEGDRVFLPPAPPEDKAWYEKVVDAIKWCIGKLKDLADDVGFVAWVLQQVFVTIPLSVANDLAKDVQLDKVAAATGIDHAISAGGWVAGQADTAVNMASHSDYYAASILDQAGVPAAEWINLRGKMQSAVSKAANTARPTNPEYFKKLLVPDPFYIQHPPYGYLRIRASQQNDKSIPLVSSPGGYHVTVEGAYKDPQSPEIKGWFAMYDKTVYVPSMCDGMTMDIPIVLDYDPSFFNEKTSKTWMIRYNQCTAIRWRIDYGDYMIVQGTSSWGG